MQVSNTRINTYTTCPKKHDLTYNHKLRRIVKDKSPMLRGRLFHTGMEFFLKSVYEQRLMYNEINFKEAYAAAERAMMSETEGMESSHSIGVDSEGNLVFQGGWDDVVNDLMVIVRRTVRYLDIERYDIVAVDGIPLVEYIIDWQYDDDYNFVGVVDAVLRDKDTDIIKIVDWKLTGRYKQPLLEELNPQIGLYQYVLFKMLGVFAPVGVSFQIKNAVPTAPKLLKNGGMSRAAINTDWDTYKAHLIAAELNPDDYEEEMRPKLSGMQFFNVIELARTQTTLNNLWNNFIKKAYEVNDSVTPVYGYPCQFCPFNMWCAAELTGDDTADLIGTYYEFSIEESDEDAVEPI